MLILVDQQFIQAGCRRRHSQPFDNAFLLATNKCNIKIHKARLGCTIKIVINTIEYREDNDVKDRLKYVRACEVIP